MPITETVDKDFEDHCSAGDAGIAVMLDTAGIDRAALKTAQARRRAKASADKQDALLAAARSVF